MPLTARLMECYACFHSAALRGWMTPPQSKCFKRWDSSWNSTSLPRRKLELQKIPWTFLMTSPFLERLSKPEDTCRSFCENPVSSYRAPVKSIPKRTSSEVQIILHLTSLFHEAVKKKELRISQAYTSGNRIGCSFQLVPKGRRLPLERGGTLRIAKTLLPYMWCDKPKARFLVLFNDRKVLHHWSSGLLYLLLACHPSNKEICTNMRTAI